MLSLRLALHRTAFHAILVPALAAAFGFASQAQQQPVQLKLMPLPRSVQVTTGELVLDTKFHAGFTAYHDARIDAALDRILVRLDRRCGGIRGAQASAATTAPLTLELAIDGPGETVQSVDENESHQLTVTPQLAHIHAATDVGAMHALETFLQLVGTSNGACRLPAVTIDDAPRFRWRGLHIDVSRHFEPVEVIERNLDGMAIAKLNVFHWHLSDDQGFRAQSLKFPRLTQLASNGEFYTQDQMREVVAYARARGIRIVPEFDMPGHATSWVLAYPEIGSGEKITALTLHYDDPRAELDPSNEALYKFIDAFVGEMSGIFPDAYFHIGGDETAGKAWLDNPRIAAFMKKQGFATPADLQSYFNRRLLPILAKHEKKMLGWDEILNPALPTSIAIQSWRGVDSLADGARKGYPGLLSAPYYLDGQKTSAEMFLADPIPANTDLTPDQQKLILGGEVCMWAEQINAGSIDSRIWPRTMAIAERFWSPQSDTGVPDMYRRLRLASLELEDAGLTHISGPQQLRRNIAGTANPQALDVFATVLEPVSFGDRSDTQRTDSFTSLDRLVDAVVADPPSREQIAFLVNAAIDTSNPAEAEAAAGELRNRLRNWQQNAPDLMVLAQSSPRMSDTGDRARQLGELANTALEALAFLSSRTPPPTGWKDAQNLILTNAGKPSALVRFTFLPSLHKLVDAAAQTQP